MAKKATVDPFKAKQARQKKIVIGGSVLLLLLLAIQGPKLLKRLKGDQEVPAWLAASRSGTTAAPAPAAGIPGAVLPAPTLAGGNPTGAAAPTPGSGGLTGDQAATAGPGQLAAFTRFSSKDPFAAQVGAGPESGPTVPAPPTPPKLGGDGGNGGGIVPSKPGGSSSGGGNGTKPSPNATVSSAVIAVNGVLATVAVGSDFGVAPNGQALFHLVAATASAAKISVAGGSYANGAATLTLRLRKPVTLMNTADGTRYQLELYPPGTAVAGTSTTSVASTAPAAPAVTTTTTASP